MILKAQPLPPEPGSVLILRFPQGLDTEYRNLWLSGSNLVTASPSTRCCVALRSSVKKKGLRRTSSVVSTSKNHQNDAVEPCGNPSHEWPDCRLVLQPVAHRADKVVHPVVAAVQVVAALAKVVVSESCTSMKSDDTSNMLNTSSTPLKMNDHRVQSNRAVSLEELQA